MYLNERRRGFTIVELLIVIVVIGILAAVTLIVYNGISNKAKVSNVQAAISQTSRKITAYALTNQDVYPSTLDDAGITDTNDVSYQYVVDNGSNPRTFCIAATTQGTSYSWNSTDQKSSEGKCSITNIVTNPSFKIDANGWARNISPGLSASGTLMTDPTIPLSGINTMYRLRITAGSGSYWRAGTNLPVTGGQVYSFSSYVKTNTSMDVHIAIQWKDASGSGISAIYPTTSVSANAWTRISSARTAPTNATTVLLQVGSPANGIVNNTLDITGVMLTTGAFLYQYADGDSSGWTWNGTPNNTSSTGKPV